MDILVFILVLVALILVHEFGHFVVAKLAGMRVDEFGIGYPPKLWGKRIGGTEYTFNLLPFGGFVKIYGEDPEPGVAPSLNAFTGKNRAIQALVLTAGIIMNLLFAWVLISTTLALGTPRALTPDEAARATDATLAVASVLPGTPAAEAGLAPGDTIVSIEGAGGRFEGADPNSFTAFIAEHEAGSELMLHTVSLTGESRDIAISPRTGIVPAEPERAALGVSLTPVGIIAVPWWQAPFEGARLTWEVTKQTTVALLSFFAGIFTFTADLSQVAGPVGIAGAVGHASDSGFASLLTITAIISINLALINLLPIPALDGGRLLFVAIEALLRRPLNPLYANAVNAVGFGLLILLMLVVTANDIFRIIG